jgi:hypothetical protein
LLLTSFEPCERDKASAYIKAGKLAEKENINITDGTINKLDKAVK